MISNRSEIAIVGDDDHGPVVAMCEILKDPLYIGAGGGIEVACGLIGQDQ